MGDYSLQKLLESKGVHLLEVDDFTNLDLDEQTVYWNSLCGAVKREHGADTVVGKMFAAEDLVPDSYGLAYRFLVDYYDMFCTLDNADLSSDEPFFYGDVGVKLSKG
jgi:hypothetical protein